MLNKYNEDLVEANYEKGQEDLRSDTYLNLKANFNQDNDEDSEFRKPTYESKKDLITWRDDVFHEPRAFTLKNIRDIFFALLNQSKAQDRICDAEDNIRQLWKKCS